MSKYGPRIRKCFNKYFEDDCIYNAASSCFFLIICFLPFLLLLLNILRFFPVQVGDLQKIISDNAPEQFEIIINGLISDVFEKRSVLITSASIIFVVYSAGQGFMAIMKSFDTIYEIKVQKSWALRRLKSTAYTFLFMFIIIIFAVLYMYGSRIVNSLEPSNPGAAAVLGQIVVRRIIILPSMLLFLFLFMYMYVPNRKGKFWEELPGAVIAVIGEMIFTFIFSLIFNNAPQFNYIYGSISNVMFTLFWLFAFFLILFLGAEFNTYIKKGRVVLPKWMRISQWPLIRRIGRKKSKDSKDK